MFKKTGSKSMIVLVSFCLLLFLSQNALADGLIVVPPTIDTVSSFPLEVKYHHVEVTIKNQTALTMVDQEFYNPTGRRLEGTYLFPIPHGAVIKSFKMVIDGKEMEAELLDAAKAKKIYEEIVRKQLDPALLEYSGKAVFKVRIFPVEPRSSKKIKLAYQEILNRDNGTFQYTYPLNTEKFSAGNLQEVRINVEIQSDDQIKNVYCASHEAQITRQGDRRALVGYQARDIKPDTDFRVYFNTDNSKIGLSLAAYQKAGEDGYFFLNISPAVSIKESEITEKAITFVLDNSGSMAGPKMEQAKKALLFCINNLNKADRFEIIRFSTEAEALFGKLMKADQNNLQKAQAFVEDLKAIGGTNIEEALRLALSAKKEADRPHLVVFITDGKPTIGETNEDLLLDKIKAQNQAGARIFTFGIGNEINTHLLDKITELTRAYRTYISPTEDLEISISDFYTKVQSPVLTDLSLHFGEKVRVFQTYPAELSDLFKGSSLTVLGKYRGEGRIKVILEGKLGQNRQKWEFDTEFPAQNTENDFIPPLWAARRIGYLLDQIRLHGEDRELVEEITGLARQFGIITPYTSYLILEDETNRVTRRELPEENQTLGNILPNTGDLAASNKKEYQQMGEKSGQGSVQTSKEIQALNKAANADQTRQGGSRLGYQDQNGASRNLNQQVKNIQGRAVYNTGSFWVDSQVQAQKDTRKIRIQFISKEYFDFLAKTPEAAQFLALGRNVRFVLKNQVYEIYE